MCLVGTVLPQSLSIRPPRVCFTGHVSAGERPQERRRRTGRLGAAEKTPGRSQNAGRRHRQNGGSGKGQCGSIDYFTSLPSPSPPPPHTHTDGSSASGRR